MVMAEWWRGDIGAQGILEGIWGRMERGQRGDRDGEEIEVERLERGYDWGYGVVDMGQWGDMGETFMQREIHEKYEVWNICGQVIVDRIYRYEEIYVEIYTQRGGESEGGYDLYIWRIGML